MPVLPTSSLAAMFSLALLGASCSLTTDLSGLQKGAGGGSSSSAVCGDGIIQAGEECDDGSSNPHSECVDCIVQCNRTADVKDPKTFHCYWYDGITVANFDNAIAHCAGLRTNGTLATITSEEEFTFVEKTIAVKSETWIGAIMTTTGKYRWVTGEPWDFSKWQQFYPDDSKEFAICIALGNEGLHWLNTPCATERRVLCESSPLGKPAP